MWQTMFECAAKHINRAAPNVFLYLITSYEKFAPIEGQYSLLQMTDIRNNVQARQIACETAATVALTRKHKLIPLPKIKVEHDFNTITIQENLRAPSSNYARHIVREDDPVDIYIPLNELAYCLRPESRDLTRALYWMAWILKFSSQYKKQNKKPFDCSFRANKYIDDSFSRNAVWLIWDTIQDSVRLSPQQGVLLPYIDALYKIHCLRWSPTVLKNRICFANCAAMFICESNTLDIHYPVPQNIITVKSIVENIPEWIKSIVHTQKTFSA